MRCLREVGVVLQSRVPAGRRGSAARRRRVRRHASRTPARTLARRSAARSGRVLAEGLTRRASRSRISGGISTYPFDGAKPTPLLRAADQALYAAKAAGKNRVARSVSSRTRLAPIPAAAASTSASQADGAAGGSTARARCSPTRWRRPRRSRPRRPWTASRASVQGARVRRRRDGLLRVARASATTSSTRPSMRSARSRSVTRPRTGSRDFPLTAEVLRSGEPRAVSFVDGDVDPAEAFILRELGMNALLMLPIRVGGRAWGLIELYEMRLRRFARGRRRRGAVPRRPGRATARDRRRRRRRPRRRPRVYELPPALATRRRARARDRRSAGHRRREAASGRSGPRRTLRPRCRRRSPSVSGDRLDLDEPVAVAGNEHELHELGLGRRRGRAARSSSSVSRARDLPPRVPRRRARAARRAARFSSTAPSSCRRRARSSSAGEAAPPVGESEEKSAELSLSRLEIGRPEPEHALDRARESRRSSSRRSSSAIDSWSRAACSSSSLRRCASSSSSRSSASGPGERTRRTSPCEARRRGSGRRRLSSPCSASARCRRTDPKPSSSERSAGSTRLRRSAGESCRSPLPRG